MTRGKILTVDDLRPRERQALGLIDCADGMSMPDLMALMGVTFGTVHEFVNALAGAGFATRVKAPGVTHKRFFRHAKHAAAWLEAHEAAARAEKAKGDAARAEAAAARAAKKAATGVSFNTINKAGKPAASSQAAKVKVEATNPNGVVPTVIAAPVDTRFFVGPAETPPAVFSAARIGFDPMTGQKWGATA